MDPEHTPSADRTSVGLTRRALLRRASVGAVVWTAPALITWRPGADLPDQLPPCPPPAGTKCTFCENPPPAKSSTKKVDCQGTCDPLFGADGNPVVGTGGTCTLVNGPKCECVYVNAQPGDPCPQRVQPSGKCAPADCPPLYRSPEDARLGRNLIKGICELLKNPTPPPAVKCVCVYRYQNL